MFSEFEKVLNEGLNANRYMGVPKILSLKTDIKNCQDKYVVICDVPGLKKEDIKVSMEAEVLTIAVNINRMETEKDFAYLIRERAEGRISRSFRLPDVDTSKVSAALEDGILTLTLPKLAEKAKRTIEIQ
jgi:HSP20 family protein